MQNIIRPDRDPLSDATNIVPLGLHHSSTGKLTFDPLDPSLAEDLKAFASIFVAEYPEIGTWPPGFSEAVLDLAQQRDAMSKMLFEMLSQMQNADGRVEPIRLETLLASTFDRFPQFVDFTDIAEGSGDMALDPSHPDRALYDETAFKLGGRS